MSDTVVIHSEGEILAAKARDEYIDTGKTTVKCPKCNQLPRVDIKGSNHSHVLIRCSCGYMSLYEKGI